MSNLQTKSQTQELAVKLNESVLAVLGVENVQGFEKSYQIANSIQFLKENLTDEYMNPIMSHVVVSCIIASFPSSAPLMILR